MSSDQELDFVWVPQANTKKLVCTDPQSPYRPAEGAAILFLHCDDAENIYIKGRKFSPEALANRLPRLPGYDEGACL